LLETGEGEVDVSVSSSKIRFATASLTLTSKLIDGTFPDYERVIPRNNDKAMIASSRDFAQAVDRVSTISLEKSRAVKLSLSNGKLTLAVNNPESGSAEEEIMVDYAGDAIDVGFNSRYILDVAAQVGADNIRFEFKDAGSPTVVRDPGDAQTLYVLMPMRV
jgi:DNA polymerase-3 subunit beta